MIPDKNDSRLQNLATATKNQYFAKHGRTADYTAVAPGRVNLIGEHVDYNDGVVLPFAIERHTVVAGGPVDHSQTCSIFSMPLDVEVEIDLAKPLAPRDHCWSNYVMGVVAEFQRMGQSIPAFNLVINSDIPIGAGLSSSAALEVSTATFLEALLSLKIEKTQKAQLCQKAENEFVGMRCGIMDQLASTFGTRGHLIQIDCHSLSVELIPIHDDVSFLIADSRANHQLIDGAYELRRRQCESALQKIGKKSYRNISFEDIEHANPKLNEVECRRAQHIVSEIQRTLEAAALIKNRDWPNVGELLYQSHSSLRDNFEVSCHELDILVDIAKSIGPEGGVLGSRMTGGGFGGSTITVVRQHQLASVSKKISSSYELKTGISPRLFASNPARGTQIL